MLATELLVLPRINVSDKEVHVNTLGSVLCSMVQAFLCFNHRVNCSPLRMEPQLNSSSMSLT